MTYNRPLLNLLSNEVVSYKTYKEAADSYNNAILECFKAHKVGVSQLGYKISPVNMVFNYSLATDVAFKTIQNLSEDVSLSVGYDIKVFKRNDESHAFSISVPRGSRSYVGLREILSSEEYKQSKSPLTIAVGIDELAKKVVFDLAEAPHLLISGTTGSGKTVYLDDIILSIIYNEKASPSKVKLVLVDPAADLKAYSGLPHLLFKPVSEKWEAYEVIKYIRNRMNERFETLSKDGVRNISAYNAKHTKKPLSRIVVIIDKYLEYTYEMPTDFEDCIKEITRKGRAAGIHMIINAQSARSEVVSADIKANIPCRIAFSVTDWHESKAILDKTGAQKLLGNGDMLFSPGLNMLPLHIQAPIVRLDEIENVVANTIARNGIANYVRDFNDIREPVEDNVEHVLEILEAVSKVNVIDVFSAQKLLNVSYEEALDTIRFLEINQAVSGYVGNRNGRTVNHDIVERLINEFKLHLQESDS